MKLFGTLKFWNSAKGFGFIRSESGQDIFCHAYALEDRERTPAQGDLVEFTISPDAKHPGQFKAREVRIGRSVGEL